MISKSVSLALTGSVKKLFQKDVRYVIPPFQRPYIWNQEDQWEPLWEDVRNAAERYLEALAEAEGKCAEAEQKAGSHFLGALVLQQELTASAEIETRIVIDGQQRITSLQIVLDAAQEVFENLGNVTEAKRLSRLVLNADGEDDDAFKVWPTALDQDAFRAAMLNAASPEAFSDSPIVQAHEFFRLQISEWLEEPFDQTEQKDRIHGLETALYGLLELVVIDLGASDDAYVIFETLNARGTPLLASDLVKNFVLQTADAASLDTQALHEMHWKPLEERWWREEVRQGRLIRPRLDVYLNYWLTMRLAEEVPSHSVFAKFRGFADGGGRSIVDVVADIHHVAETFRALDTFEPWSPEGTFLHRWRVMDAGVTTPVLLWLFSQESDRLSPDERMRCLRAIESYLVRRMACRMTTKDYNRMFLELLPKLESAPPGEAASEVVSHLAASSSESRVWPDDVRLRHAFVDLPLYRLLTRGRLRTVLEALEDSFRGPKTEEEHVSRGTLTIEHVMPQKWEENWPLPPNANEEDAVSERERVIHSIGNLTLVNKRLNPSLSNADWHTKARALVQHSVLHLNKQLLSSFTESDFSEAQIRERGKTLAGQATTIWPGPVPFWVQVR